MKPPEPQLGSAAVETDYRDKYEKIQTVIEDLNGKLMEMFHRKEQHLLEEYKKEMFRAQNELNELRDNTNEEELKKKMIEKKEQLQKEREQFLQASIFFSNKCEQFKQKLARVVSDTRDLQSEIRFLGEQIDQANAAKLHLQEELSCLDNGLNTSISSKPALQTAQKPSHRYQEEEAPSLRKQSQQRLPNQNQNQNSSLKRNHSQLNYPSGTKSEVKRTKERTQRIREVLNDPIFQETDFERMFVESVSAVKDQKALKGREPGKTLPLLKKNPQSMATLEPDRPHREHPRVSDSELTEYDKRSIMEDFLAKEEVKQYLYKLIFKEAVELRKPKSKTPSLREAQGDEHV